MVHKSRCSTLWDHPSTRMWCVVMTRTCSLGPSRSKQARIKGPRRRSNGALASARIDAHSFASRSDSGTPSREVADNAIHREGAMTWTISSLTLSNVVRKVSWRSTSNWRLLSRVTWLRLPVSRRQARMWSAGFPGANCSSTQKRRCAALAGIA